MSPRRCPWLSSLLWLLLLAGAVQPATAESDAGDPLARALAAYAEAQAIPDDEARRARFRGAERLFAAALEGAAPSPDLYANLGTAALLGRRTGTAIWAFRSALALDPGHVRARTNLDVARTLLPEWVPRPEARGTVRGFVDGLRATSARERALWAAWAFAAAGALVLAGALRSSAASRALGGLAAAIWLLLLISAGLPSGAGDEAVLVAPETVARASDSIHAPRRLAEPLPAGVEVRILEQRADWLRVALANGREAWIPASAARRIADPQPLRNAGDVPRPAPHAVSSALRRGPRAGLRGPDAPDVAQT